MKKIYLQPKLVIVNVKVMSTILEGSLLKSTNTVNGNKGGWTREDNSWDIWGTDADDELE